MSKKTFEESMKQLEQIVEELESGNLPLEKTLKKFEDGVKLSKACNKKLDEIEKKVTILIKDSNGEIKEETFMTGDEEEDG